MRLDWKSGQAFLDRAIFTMSQTLDFHSGKTLDQPIPSREKRNSPRTVSTGETPLQKMSKAVAPRGTRLDSEVINKL